MQYDGDSIETAEKTETIDLGWFNTLFINIKTPKPETTVAETTSTTFEEVIVLVTTTETTTSITVTLTTSVDGMYLY